MKYPDIAPFGGSDSKETGELVSLRINPGPSSADHRDETEGLLGNNYTRLYDTIPPLNPKKVEEVVISRGKAVAEDTNWKGIFLAFLSGLFFTLCSGSVKYLTHINPMELLFIRSLLQVAAMLPIALYNKKNIMGPPGYRLLLLGQGIVGGTTLALLFYAFRNLPLGDAATIIFSSPVFVMVMSFIWLREPCGLFRTIIVFLLVSGVILISKPPFLFPSVAVEQVDYNILGYLAAILATFFTAINIVVMRKCKEVHFSVAVFQFSFWSLVISLALVIFFADYSFPDNTLDWMLVVAMATFGLSGQVLVAKALRLEGAGRVAVTRSMDIVLAYIIQVTVFGEFPNWESIGGASLVMVAVICMGLESTILKCFQKMP